MGAARPPPRSSALQRWSRVVSKAWGGGGGKRKKGWGGARHNRQRGASNAEVKHRGMVPFVWSGSTGILGSGSRFLSMPDACDQAGRCVDSKHSQTTPPTTSTSSIRQLLGAADTQTAHHATFSTVPTGQLLGSANAETTPARAPAAAADRK